MHRSPSLLLSFTLILAACTAPPYRDSLEGGLNLLDADRYDDARAHFECASSTAEDEEEEILARALVIECWIGAGVREEAEPLVQKLCAEHPRSFLAWKCATALELRFSAFADAAAYVRSRAQRVERELALRAQRAAVESFGAAPPTWSAIRR